MLSPSSPAPLPTLRKLWHRPDDGRPSGLADKPGAGSPRGQPGILVVGVDNQSIPIEKCIRRPILRKGTRAGGATEAVDTDRADVHDAGYRALREAWNARKIILRLREEDLPPSN